MDAACGEDVLHIFSETCDKLGFGLTVRLAKISASKEIPIEKVSNLMHVSSHNEWPK